MKPITLALLFLAWTAGAAQADVILKMQETNLKPKTPESTAGTLWLAGDRMASLFEKAKDEEQATHIIYRGDKKLLWMLMDDDKKYMEMTKASMEEMGNKVGDAMAKMQEQMAKLSPEQRKMIEEQMKGNPMMAGGAAAKPPVRTVKKTAETKEINGFPCTKYEVSLDGKLRSEVWATPYARFEVKPADLQVLTDMSKMFESITAKLGGDDSAKNRFGNAEGIDGVPILTRFLNVEGTATSETSILSVSHDRADPKQFVLPDGYAKMDPLSGKKH